MDTTFTLKGLDCPNCAAKIEAEAAKIHGVSKAQVNLIKQTLKIRIHPDHAKDLESIHDQIEAIVHNHEPEVEVIHHDCAHQAHDILPPKCCDCPHCHDCASSESDDDSPYRLVRLIVGGVLAAICIAAYYLFHPATIFILPPLLICYLILGFDVLWRAGSNMMKGRFFDENFLMMIATFGAFAIGEYPEAIAVMLFYQIGEYFQDKAVDKSRRDINALLDIRPDMARVLRNDVYCEVPPQEIAIGESILVKPGERIPLDGCIQQGCSILDTRALTGESLPCEVKPGDRVLSGCINQNAALTIEVLKPFGESTASRIVDMVENAASRKAPAEQFITRFARYYTPIVVVAALLIAVIPVLLGLGEWTDWMRRACVFLVISCPCALVISIPLTFFGGLGAASQRGILIKGSNYLEALNRIDTMVFDKTGTLTKGNFKVIHILPAKGVSESDLLIAAALSEKDSNHPIALSIMQEAQSRNTLVDTTRKYMDYQETAGRGICVSYSESEQYHAGNAEFLKTHHIDFDPCEDIGSKVYIAKNHIYLGCLVIADEIKPGSVQTIQTLKNTNHIKTIMLTGDNHTIARDIAQKLNIDACESELLPEQKVEKLEALSHAHTVSFVGDGINDAPVLARADIGIAMGALGADAAIEAADIVLMTDEPARLIDALQIAAQTHAIVMQNIIFAIGIKILFLLLGALGLIGLWPAVFADVGVMVLAVLNAMRMLKLNPGQSPGSAVTESSLTIS